MRIVIMSPYLGDWAGQERVIRDSVALLRSVGHRVFLLGDEKKRELPDNDGALILPGLARIDVIRKRAERKKLHQVALQFLAETKPDVIHFTDTFDAGLVRVIGRRYATVFTAHSVSATCPAGHRLIRGNAVCPEVSGWSCLRHTADYRCLSGFRGWARKAHVVWNFRSRMRAIKKIPQIIATSEYIRGLLIRDGWSAKKIRVIYNPVARPGEVTPQSIPENLIISAARLNSLKGIAHLIHAVKLIENLPWTLWICGDGPLRNDLEALVGRLNLSPRISFKGMLPYAQIQSILSSSRCLVQPNVGPEAFGLSVAEAMALGVPVLGSRVPALDELIENNVTGLLVAPGNASALAQAIERIFSDADLVRRIRQEGPRRVESLFSPAAHLAKLLEVYESAKAGNA